MYVQSQPKDEQENTKIWDNIHNELKKEFGIVAYKSWLIRLKIFGFKANLCVAKELTKVHENYFRGSAKEILDKFNENKQLVKGEFVLLIHFEKTDQDYSIADKAYKKLKSKVPIKELSKIVSDLTGINKNLLYKRFLSFSQKS